MSHYPRDRLPPPISWSRRPSAIARSLQACAFRAMPPTNSRTPKRISRVPPSAWSRVGGFVPFINTPSTAPIPPEYEGVAANVSIPVFNGHLFAARREAAAQRAMEADQRLRDEQQRISRDVRVAWASANDAYQRIDVTAQFLRQAALALDLAQGRYNLGLSSIVELTQAQLNLTQAEIENLNAKYDYQTQYSALQYTIGLLR